MGREDVVCKGRPEVISLQNDYLVRVCWYNCQGQLQLLINKMEKKDSTALFVVSYTQRAPLGIAFRSPNYKESVSSFPLLLPSLFKI